MRQNTPQLQDPAVSICTSDTAVPLLVATSTLHKCNMLYICKLTDDGQWQGLRSTTDEEYAERIVDFYCNKWPNAYIDILTFEEYHGGKAKWEQMAITN